VKDVGAIVWLSCKARIRKTHRGFRDSYVVLALATLVNFGERLRAVSTCGHHRFTTYLTIALPTARVTRENTGERDRNERVSSCISRLTKRAHLRPCSSADKNDPGSPRAKRTATYVAQQGTRSGICRARRVMISEK